MQQSDKSVELFAWVTSLCEDQIDYIFVVSWHNQNIEDNSNI